MTREIQAKADAMAKAMEIINPDGILIPGGRAHQIVTETITSMIERLGPEKALEQIEQTKEHHRAQIYQMEM